MRRATGLVIVVAVLGLSGITGFLLIDRLGGSAEPDTTVVETRSNALVVRTDLVEADTLDGLLRYREPGTLIATGGGTLTALPAQGDRIGRGDAAYELDGSTVTTMFGDRPPWRTIGDGVDDGADIRQLEANLWALGFDPDFEMTIDNEFDEATRRAVEAWQESLGRDETQVVLPSEIVFLPAPARVGEHLAEIGAVVTPGTPLYTTSAQGHEVVVLLDAARQELLSAGDQVTVVLPDDTEIAGLVREVSAVVMTEGRGDEARRVVEVLVDLANERAAGELDEAPVDVEVTTDRAEDVLAVPVEALLALAEGGYAVELDEGATTRLVGVEIGTFADGLVEVMGDLSAGDLVVVAG